MKVLKFGAEWCGPCKLQNKILDELQTEHPDLQINRIDVDNEETEPLVSKYGIQSVPVIIILNDNNEEVKRFVGLTQKKQIIEVL